MRESIARTDINIRSGRYFIACTRGTCGRCQASTLLFALALPPGHEALEWDEAWTVATHNAFLFHIDYLPQAIRRRLRGLTLSYRFGRGPGAVDPYWANHCGHCNFLLDDDELFCEPDGAFLPTSAARAGRIRLTPMDEAIEAAAAGYTCDPMFFDAMTLE